MMLTDLKTITCLKQQLSTVIQINQYNLLAPEVLALSAYINNLMIPLFKQQLEEE